MELWDLYDRGRKKTGLSQIRGEPIPKGHYHLVVHVWIRNGSGEYLISQRSPDREKDPLKWECVGGSALMGEDSLSAASREVQEERGPPSYSRTKKQKAYTLAGFSSIAYTIGKATERA